MIKRLKTGAGVAAGLAALALGGSAIAGAASNQPAAPAGAPVTQESTTGPDTDTVQSGDQSTPDTPGSAEASSASDPADSGTEAPGTEAAGSESAGESAVGNDGPGGHADEPGNPNADTQQQGQH